MGRITLTAIAILLSATSGASEIPLKNIYALNIPGTIELEAGIYEDSRSTATNILVGDIAKALPFLPETSQPRPGFAVVGTGKKAIRAAHAVLAKNGAVRQTLPSDTELSAVFFSYEVGSYVELVKVLATRNGITIQYRFVAHDTKDMSHHFALIPIGCFNRGKVSLKIEQVDEKGNSVDTRWQPVSKSFTFEVR